MHVLITPQNTDISQSVNSFAEYLEKENDGKKLADREAFFSHDRDQVSRFEVIDRIDRNKAKLKKKEPKFYSITLNPSVKELNLANATSADLKDYTRQTMEAYVKSFNREINGRPLDVNDLIYYGKIEHTRKYTHKDKQVLENRPYTQEINRLKKLEPSKENLKSIDRLTLQTPHKIDGKPIVEGMLKPGDQRHIHIIVSRKDASNTFSLSPGSKYKSSTTDLNGKEVKRGFNRDQFIENAEKVFDKKFNIDRNYILSYRGKRDYKYDYKRFINRLTGLPTSQRQAANKILKLRGNPLNTIPLTPAQAAHKAVDIVLKSGRKIIEAGTIQI